MEVAVLWGYHTPIPKAADILADFIHDMQPHLPAEMVTQRTHEKMVLYQTAKLRTLLVYNVDNLVLKEKILVGRIFHIRGCSYIFQKWIF